MTTINLRRRSMLALCAGALLATSVFEARANDPIRFIVPFATGGSSDSLARLIANWMSQAGQPVIVENKPGAGGTIGVRTVLQSPADGKTFLFTPASPITMNPFLVKDLAYDPQTDLTPIGRLFRTSSIMVTNADGPYQSVADLLQASKAGKPISFASGSTGYTLLFTDFAKRSGLNAVVANYKGASAAAMDVAGGFADFSVVDPLVAYKLVEQKKLRALAVFDEAADPVLTSTPTSAQAGLGPPAFYQWITVFARAGTPQPVITRMEGLLKSASEDPALRAAAMQMALAPYWGDAQATRQLMQSEMNIVRLLVRQAGIEPQ